MDDLYIYSFYPTKPVGSVDGGMIVSKDKKKIDQLRILAYNGTSNSVNSWEKSVKSVGYKCYMNSVQAYIANENLKRLDEKLYKLSKVRDQYNMALKLQNTSSHLYRVNVKEDLPGVNRIVLEKARKAGIMCGIHYKPLNLLEALLKYHSQFRELSKSWKEGMTTLSIPFHEKLTQKEINKVIKFTKQYVK